MVKRGAINDRIDAIYCSPSNRLEIIKKTAYPVNKLSDLAYLQRGRFSHRPRNDPKFYDGQYPFIQTGDIVKASQEGGEIVFTQSLNELGLSVSKLFQPDVLVMTIAANIGDTAILTYPACFPDSLVTITPKGNRVSVEYLNVYSKFLKKYLDNLAPQAAQKNINLQQLSPTPVVVPPIEVQAQIVQKFNQAYELKRQKEAEAKALLESIDGYLLEKLGIELPTANKPKKVFYTRFKDVQGKRFDPLFNQYDIYQLMRSGKFKVEKLKSVANYFVTGFAAGKQDQDLEEKGVIQIRPTNIKDPKRSLIFDKNVYIRSDEALKRTNDILQKNEVLFTNTSSQELVGKTTIFNLDGVFLCSNHITRIRINTKNNPLFFVHVLNLYQHQRIFYRSCVNWNNQSGINVEWLKQVEIPVPPLEIQNEVVQHITNLSQQAKTLEDEAKEAIETAKAEVERMILGES